MRINNIYQGDSLATLKTLSDNSINCCITSPPYYGLRDYGVDGQIGLEETPEQFINKLVEIFREIRRIIKDDGTLWVNIGDSYNGSGGQGTKPNIMSKDAAIKRGGSPIRINTLKPKDLIGIPWMLAFALRADGWYLRQDIIWHKPNPMPESVQDRCTKAHEYVFLLSKSQKYYYDIDAIKEPAITPIDTKSSQSFKAKGGKAQVNYGTNEDNWEPDGTRNKRSVWQVNTKPYREAHFATFPEALIEPMILAGCPKDGIVIDPFMGAGTTAVVSKKNHRNYIGCELNEKYIEIAKKRIDSVKVNLEMFV